MGIRESVIKIIALGVLCLALVAVFLNGQSLLAYGYSNYAIESLNRNSSNENGLAAAQLATRLTPYADRQLALEARQLARHGEREQALQLFRQALTKMPRDPFLWLEFGNFLTELGLFGHELEGAVTNVQHLAPRSFALHYKLAQQGIKYWRWGSLAQQQCWAESIFFVINIDPKPLLRHALQERRSEVLCNEPLLKRADMAFWCAGAKAARPTCFQAVVPPRWRKWCRRLDYVQDPLQ